ncbi:RND transporter [Novimethylophilus kurashikiensis]|uniref:RND transporter n=1 Tax=Novimethylophilus kurashikiensis TaxID=1825523 RepID=A0A2R5FE57_9PROT|nr:hypothetical protein [Novimethylophilus kurashikiensis]GBG14774.1 RND transporter [Novimethylophilus kurashikiensis]
MKMKMSGIFSGTAAISIGAALLLGGCAIESPKKPVAIEQRIQSAHTPQDHQNIASEYERQAAADTAAAKAHSEMAQRYKYFTGPKGTAPGAFSSHCDNLAKLYEQAAAENRELARLHQEAAADLSTSGSRQ